MLRKISAITVAISFLALATSGMMMFFVETPSFTIQMHPVHKMFGLLMVLAGIIHISLNSKTLFKYLKVKSVSIYGGVLVVALVFLYSVAINREIPAELAEQMDSAAKQAEGRH